MALLVAALFFGATGGAVASIVVTGSHIKDGTVTTADIKNGSLTKADLLDEPVAWGHQGGLTGPFTEGSPTVLVSRSVGVPASGFLSVTASLYGEDVALSAGLGRLAYSLRIDGKTLDEGTLWFNCDNPGSFSGDDGTLNAVISVTKGTRKIEIMIQEYGTGTWLYGGSINALYTSTGASTGFAPVPRPMTPRQQR